MLILSSLPERLRAATRAHHDQIEASIGLPRTLSEYRTQLETFHGFIAPLEERLVQTLGGESPWLLSRMKAGYLEEDLLSLGYTPAAVEQLPRCGDLPGTSSEAECLGILYVIEGSTLGGQMIAMHLAKTLGSDVTCRYFRSYGPRVMELWQAFKVRLTECVAPEHHEVVVQSAQKTFSKLHAWCVQSAPLT